MPKLKAAPKRSAPRCRPIPVASGPVARPILFSTELVPRLLDDTKTQTRRPAKQPISIDLPRDVYGDWPIGHTTRAPAGRYRAAFNPNYAVSVLATDGNMLGIKPAEFVPVCPFGSVGDLLWVREAWAPHESDGEEEVSIVYRASYDPAANGSACDQGATEAFPVTQEIARAFSDEIGRYEVFGEKWRPSIHMPRWASRILLEITSVRLEPLKSISTDDIRAEGFPIGTAWHTFVKCYRSQAERDFELRSRFLKKWDELNAARGYPSQDDPLVWAIGFRRVLKEGAHG